MACGRHGEVVCDLLNAAETAQLLRSRPWTSVVHCAAAVPQSAKDYADETLADHSLRMTATIAACCESPLVFASSMTVYDSNTDHREDAPCKPSSAYARAKYAAERALLASALATVTIFRIPGLFGGVRSGGLIYNVAGALAQGDLPTIASNPPLWAGMHVDDAAAVLAEAAIRPPAGKTVLNLGYGEPMNVANLANRLAALAGISWRANEENCPVFDPDTSRLATWLGRPVGSLAARLTEALALARLHAPTRTET